MSETESAEGGPQDNSGGVFHQEEGRLQASCTTDTNNDSSSVIDNSGQAPVDATSSGWHRGSLDECSGVFHQKEGRLRAGHTSDTVEASSSAIDDSVQESVDATSSGRQRRRADDTDDRENYDDGVAVGQKTVNVLRGRRRRSSTRSRRRRHRRADNTDLYDDCDTDGVESLDDSDTAGPSSVANNDGCCKVRRRRRCRRRRTSKRRRRSCRRRSRCRRRRRRRHSCKIKMNFDPWASECRLSQRCPMKNCRALTGLAATRTLLPSINHGSVAARAPRRRKRSAGDKSPATSKRQRTK